DKAVPFATGLDDPTGMAGWGEWLFVADRQRVWRIDRKGKASEFAAAKAFPTPPVGLRDMDVDEQGSLYVADKGMSGGAIYRIDAHGRVSRATDSKQSPDLQSPAGITMD